MREGNRCASSLQGEQLTSQHNILADLGCQAAHATHQDMCTYVHAHMPSVHRDLATRTRRATAEALPVMRF